MLRHRFHQPSFQLPLHHAICLPHMHHESTTAIAPIWKKLPGPGSAGDHTCLADGLGGTGDGFNVGTEQAQRGERCGRLTYQ